MMPLPERSIPGGVGSYITKEEIEKRGDLGPWRRILQSARRWVR